MKPKGEEVLDVDFIGNQDEQLTEAEAEKLHAYFQKKKKDTLMKSKPESPSRKKKHST